MITNFRIHEAVKLKKSCKTFIRKKFEVTTPAIVGRSKTIAGAVSPIEGLREIRKGEKVLIKPNINSNDPYPGTSRLEGLKELIALLKKKGAQVSVGDMSSMYWSHTRVCAEKTGISQLCKEEDVPLAFFEDYGWVKVPLPNTSLGSCYLTEVLCDFDHLINLGVLKTHRLADFTLSLKNLMGTLHMRTRMRMHAHCLRQKIAEFNLALNPTLNILDGTKCFIDGGPDKGELREPGIVLASADRVALDVAGIKLLQELGSKSLSGLNPWEHPQVKAAVSLGLGAKSESEIRVLTG